MYRLKGYKNYYNSYCINCGYLLMQKVPVEELVEDKVLPYNLYDVNGDKLFDAGEILTPGKLLQLQQVSEVFKDESEEEENQDIKKEADSKPKETTQKSSNEKDSKQSTEHIVVDDFEMDAINEEITYSMDDMDISNFKGALNRKAQIDPESQMKFKAFHIYILNSLNSKTPSDLAQMYNHLKERIISDIILKAEKIHYYSELKLMGEYKKCHALNVAILSGILAHKMSVRESLLSDVVLSALLHDIGKTKIPSTILDLPTLTDKEQKILQTHTKIGYKMLKEELLFPENIARVALEHHENSNGSGYPYGKSGDYIGIESRIVTVCNHFDNLISNKTNQKIHNCHEALKIMLELGSRRFAADALYTFAHMFSYNDIESLEEMSV